jgi:hypothetical protein
MIVMLILYDLIVGKRLVRAPGGDDGDLTLEVNPRLQDRFTLTQSFPRRPDIPRRGDLHLSFTIVTEAYRL